MGKPVRRMPQEHTRASHRHAVRPLVKRAVSPAAVAASSARKVARRMRPPGGRFPTRLATRTARTPRDPFIHVSKATGINGSLVWRYEAGERTPSFRTLGRFATLYGCGVDRFYDPAANEDDDPVAEYDAQLRAVVVALPPLTPEQRIRLAGLLVNGAA